MTIEFDVSVKELKKVHDMPGTWREEDCHNLLVALDVDGFESIQGEELLEMTVMALQDMDAEDAADAVLAYKLHDSVSAGVRQNIIQDLIEGSRPWEEYADIMLHSQIFAVSVMLYKAFPQTFPKPDTMRLILEIKTNDPGVVALFLKTPEPAFVTRILADGMDKDSILERLFEDQLVSHSFPEAAGIIWHVEYSNVREDSDAAAELLIYSAVSWLEDMEDVETFRSTAYNDNQKSATDIRAQGQGK